MFVRYQQTERSNLGTQLYGIASEIVRLVAEKDKPNGLAAA